MTYFKQITLGNLLYPKLLEHRPNLCLDKKVLCHQFLEAQEMQGCLLTHFPDIMGAIRAQNVTVLKFKCNTGEEII